MEPPDRPQDGRRLEIKQAAREILEEPEMRAIMHRIVELRKGRRLDL